MGQNILYYVNESSKSLRWVTGISTCFDTWMAWLVGWLIDRQNCHKQLVGFPGKNYVYICVYCVYVSYQWNVLSLSYDQDVYFHHTFPTQTHTDSYDHGIIKLILNSQSKTYSIKLLSNSQIFKSLRPS